MTKVAEKARTKVVTKASLKVDEMGVPMAARRV
jgi:hypothetical protein